MRFILSVSAACALALGVLTACTNTNTSLNAGNSTNSNMTVAKNTSDTKNTTVTNAPKTDEHGHETADARITLADAKKDFDAGNVVFVDTRAAFQYEAERIKGAINVPAEAVAQEYTKIPKGKKIIAYCS